MSEMYTAEVVADSISRAGHRITSVKVIYPHAVHKDMLRHRAHNRNVESFRAQPPEKLIENLRNGGAFKPDVFAQRVRGMGQGIDAIGDAQAASRSWDNHVNDALDRAEFFLSLGIAKQQVNFLLQDLCPLTEIITATDWDNFFALRTELKDDGTPVARPEVYKTAQAIKDAIDASKPIELGYDDLHLPMITDDELDLWQSIRDNSKPDARQSNDEHWIHVSAGRCARISFGDFKWWEEDHLDSHARAIRLLENGHMSPFEQQAKPFSKVRLHLINEMREHIIETIEFHQLPEVEINEMVRQLEYSGNLHGWVPARKNFPGEYNYADLKKKVV